MSLAIARRMAQQRIDEAKLHPRFHIIIWDENNAFLERFEVGAFLGDFRSEVFYCLRGDVEGYDESVFAVEGGLLGREEGEKDGCTGSWNLAAGERGKNGKGKGRGKDRWWHTERGRWREVGLETLF